MRRERDPMSTVYGVKAGWLQKESPKKVMGVSAMQRRFLVLHTDGVDAPKLQYFKAPPPGEEAGSVLLHGETVVRRVEERGIEVVEGSSDRCYKLQVRSPNTCYARVVARRA